MTTLYLSKDFRIEYVKEPNYHVTTDAEFWVIMTEKCELKDRRREFLVSRNYYLDIFKALILDMIESHERGLKEQMAAKYGRSPADNRRLLRGRMTYSALKDWVTSKGKIAESAQMDWIEMAFRFGQESAREEIIKAGPLWLDEDMKGVIFADQVKKDWRDRVTNFFRKISL